MRGIRRYVTSLVLVVLVAGGLVGTTLALNLRPRLGLDLRGGLSMILTAPERTRQDILERTVAILRDRVDRAGVAEPEISREGNNNILIQLPGPRDAKERRRLQQLVGRTAQLQFRQVKAEISKNDPQFDSVPVTEDDNPAADAVYPTKEGVAKLQLGPSEVSGGLVRDGKAVVDPNTGAWTVELRFNSEGSRKWKDFTGRLACQQGPQRRIAVVLDQIVESSPQVAENVQCNEGIAGSTEITGNFSEAEAKDLALVLTTGALPVKLEQSQIVEVSPTLGRESLRAGLTAGALGLALILLFVLVYYRSLGLQTWLGLACFAAIIYGLIVALGQLIGWSLTLAGIAGLIVAIGIATDSYIVFYERVKEEVHAGKTLRSSMDRGFKQAFHTLWTADGVTFMAAIVLYLLAVGPVRGFALALGTATMIDLAIFTSFTWPLAALLARNRFFSEGRFIGMRRALEGPSKSRIGWLRKVYRSEFSIEFVGRRRLWLIISGVLVVASFVLLVPQVRGLDFGIDFKGGTIFRVDVDHRVAPADVTAVMAANGHPEAVVQVLSDPVTGKRQVQAQTSAITQPDERTKVSDALAEHVGNQEVNVESVGQKWGRQITTKALRGLVVFLLLVILYMSWRLEPKMAVSGIVALLHDLVITAGVYAAIGFDVSPATVIAILTILGYSLYDTVVVFDKIRENVANPQNARKSYATIANESTNQVLMRSINTSLVTLLPVGSLLFVGSFLLGAETLKDLALALFVGIASGTYSSIFVATPLLSFWKEKEPRFAKRQIVREAAEAHEARTRAAAAEADVAIEPDGFKPKEMEPANKGGESRPARDQVRVQQRRRPKSKRKKGRR